jgi:hypothetical protein
VPDVDGMHARQFGKGGGPVHVAVAQQDELRVDSLHKERFCEGFVEFGHGRGTTWMMRRSVRNKHARRRPVNSIEAGEIGQSRIAALIATGFRAANAPIRD